MSAKTAKTKTRVNRTLDKITNEVYQKLSVKVLGALLEIKKDYPNLPDLHWEAVSSKSLHMVWLEIHDTIAFKLERLREAIKLPENPSNGS